MMTNRKRFHLWTAGRRIPGAVVLLLTALAFMPVFVGSPYFCGAGPPPYTPQELAAPFANRAPQWSADGQSIVVNLGYRIYRVSADGSSVARIPAEDEDGQFGPSLSPDGRIVYVDATDYAPRITTINGSGGQQKRHKARSRTKIASFPAWSPDGRYIAFSAWVKNDIDRDYSSQATITDATGELTATYQPPFPISVKAGRPVWSNDGKQVAFAWQCHRRCMVTVMDTDGISRTVVDMAAIAEPGKAEWAAEGILSQVVWSPDDRTIYYALKQGHPLPAILYSTNLSTMETRHIIDLGQDPIYALSISHDGSNLLFVSYKALITKSLDDSRRIRSNGEWVWVETALRWDAGLFLINTDGTGMREIVDSRKELLGFAPRYMQASWSPDGSRIAFTDAGYSLAKGSLFTIAPDGSDLRVLTTYDDAGNVVPANAEPAQP